MKKVYESIKYYFYYELAQMIRDVICSKLQKVYWYHFVRRTPSITNYFSIFKETYYFLKNMKWCHSYLIIFC